MTASSLGQSRGGAVVRATLGDAIRIETAEQQAYFDETIGTLLRLLAADRPRLFTVAERANQIELLTLCRQRRGTALVLAEYLRDDDLLLAVIDADGFTQSPAGWTVARWQEARLVLQKPQVQDALGGADLAEPDDLIAPAPGAPPGVVMLPPAVDMSFLEGADIEEVEATAAAQSRVEKNSGIAMTMSAFQKENAVTEFEGLFEMDESSSAAVAATMAPDVPRPVSATSSFPQISQERLDAIDRGVAPPTRPVLALLNHEVPLAVASASLPPISTSKIAIDAGTSVVTRGPVPPPRALAPRPPERPAKLEMPRAIVKPIKIDASHLPLVDTQYGSSRVVFSRYGNGQLCVELHLLDEPDDPKIPLKLALSLTIPKESRSIETSAQFFVRVWDGNSLAIRNVQKSSLFRDTTRFVTISQNGMKVPIWRVRSEFLKHLEGIPGGASDLPEPQAQPVFSGKPSSATYRAPAPAALPAVVRPDLDTIEFILPNSPAQVSASPEVKQELSLLLIEPKPKRTGPTVSEIQRSIDEALERNPDDHETIEIATMVATVI